VTTATLPETAISRRRLFLGLFGLFKHPRTVVLAGIEFRRLDARSGPVRYLRIHGNEETARQALEAHLKTHRGRAYVVTSKTRAVTVAGGQIDPNRLFSRLGARKSFRAQNPAWTDRQIEQALDWLDRERPRLVKTLLPPPGGVLVAVHNNGPGYSVEDEVPLSQATHLPRRAEPHEFFLATDPADYARLATGPYNVVLQSNATGEDDGSCSRLAAARRVRYVNLEAAHGQLARQREMLDWLTDALRK
jgi:hypothetical protein